MVTGNGTSGICGVTSIGGVDQHVSNVAIAMISHKGGFSENPPSLKIIFQDVEVIKQDLFNWLIGTVNSLLATTSRKRPPPVSSHFANNRFVSQSNTISKTLSLATTAQIS